MLKGKSILLIFAAFIALSGFVIADHVIKTSSGGLSYDYNTSATNVYNITVNNTDTTAAANITQVNITLPSSFGFVSSSAWTDAGGSFSNSSSVLTWQNSVGLVMNLTFNYFSFSATNLIPGSYNVTVTTLNVTGAFSSNISVTINDTTPPTINYTTPSANNSFYNVNYLIFNITAQDYSGVDTLTLRVYNSSSGLINTSNATLATLPLYINISNLAQGTYYYNVTVNDTKGNVNNSATRQTMIDTTAPVIALGFSETEETITVTVTITESGSGISTCTAKRGSTTVTVSGSGNSRTISDSGLDCETTYTYNVTCTDAAGNSGNRTESNPTDDCTSSSSSGGGGGSEESTSFWTSTLAPTDIQLRMGYNKELKKGERVRAKVGNETHYVGIIKVSSSSATVNISSTPQQAVLDVGETKKFEVTNDSYYDISVTLNKINNSYANLTILSIYEKIAVATQNTTTLARATENNTMLGLAAASEEILSSTPLYKRAWFWIVFVLVIILAAGGGGYFYYLKRKRARVAQGLENPPV